MPDKTFSHKKAKSMPLFKAVKDRIIVLLGDNVLQATSLNPLWSGTVRTSGLTNINKHPLLVYYKSNNKSLMTHLFFQDVFLNCNASKVEKYCLKNDITFKILFIIGNVPWHSPFISNLHINIKVMFLPPNITSLTQSMDEGVVTAFKIY